VLCGVARPRSTAVSSPGCCVSEERHTPAQPASHLARLRAAVLHHKVSLLGGEGWKGEGCFLRGDSVASATAREWVRDVQDSPAAAIDSRH
jgi:hypothetical protein